MVPDKNRADFIKTSGRIPPVLISLDHVFHFNPPVDFHYVFILPMFTIVQNRVSSTMPWFHRKGEWKLDWVSQSSFSSKGSFKTRTNWCVLNKELCTSDWYFLWGRVRSNLSMSCSVPKLPLREFFLHVFTNCLLEMGRHFEYFLWKIIFTVCLNNSCDRRRE